MLRGHGGEVDMTGRESLGVALCAALVGGCCECSGGGVAVEVLDRSGDVVVVDRVTIQVDGGRAEEAECIEALSTTAGCLTWHLWSSQPGSYRVEAFQGEARVASDAFDVDKPPENPLVCCSGQISEVLSVEVR
jgi:hypothetical protein